MSFTVLESSLLQEIKEAQVEDPHLRRTVPAVSSSTKANKSIPYSNFSQESGIVKRKGKVCVQNFWDLRKKVMHDNHDVPCARHHGVDKTIQLVRITFWWPGLARDIHTYVQQCFMCKVNKQTDWDSYLPLVEFAYNNRPHKVTRMSPLEMNYGMNPTPPSTIGMPKKYPSASELLSNLQANLEIAKAKMKHAADRAKEYADRKRSPRSFEEGDRICMDNASNCVRVGYLVEQQWPHIFYTRCTCHCLHLLFEDIRRLEWVKPILDNAVKVVVFVTMKRSVLALFRKHCTKDLVKQAQTRFAFMFIMLSNLLNERVYNGLRSLMVSKEYTRKKVARTKKAKDVSSIILSAFFWRQARDIVKICAPILKVLHLADREGATMGLIYQLTNRMIEIISSIESIDSARLEEVKNLCVDTWNMLHSPLHAAAYMLQPIWKSKSPQLDSKYTCGDIKKEGVLINEMNMYKSMEALFARPIAKDESRMHNDVKWWETFEANIPNLQKLALLMLSQGSCASPCEWNWSTFSLIHTKRRNKLQPRNVEKLKEEDDCRLLALQEEHDGKIPSSSSYTIVESHAHEDIVSQEDIVVDDGDNRDDDDEDKDIDDRCMMHHYSLCYDL
ncbi:hypothetical protein KP509_12G075800 [Ceratopteris richardii]|uniref:HAT C-terminal dimerisation domain-containing protein n=1 Tax=Ceratopteris richardii TaxID=49495 RepID=A0A8T2TQY0_CERRI|nr:hypothetical protein KP509_12G075800 [Ceratopteris richardii]